MRPACPSLPLAAPRRRGGAWPWPLALALACLVGCGPKPPPPAPLSGATPPGTNAVAKATNVLDLAWLRAEFVDDPQRGVDPFFPRSVRRSPRSEAATSTSSSPGRDPAASPATLGQLRLQGLPRSRTRRFAVINGKTLAEGETQSLRLPTGPIRLKLIEIKDTSVVIEVEGLRRELQRTE